MLSSSSLNRSRIVLADEDGMLLSDTVSANKCNEFFINVGSNLASKIGSSTFDFSQFLPPSPVNSAVFLPCDTNEIDGIITALKATSSLGSDGILSKVVKAVSKHIATPLSNIINCSLTNGVFLAALKIAKITPIFKTSDKNDVSNFRPISILPFFPKLLKKLF